MSASVSHILSEEAEAYRAIIEGAPAMLWLGDEQGRCVFLNRAQREFWGVPDGQSDVFDWSSTLHPGDIDALSGPYKSAMEAQAPFELEARYRRHDGVWRTLRTSARPHFSPAGLFLGMVGVNTDITEQRQAEEALRHSAEQLQLALDASAGVGTWVWDVQQDLIHVDRNMAQAFNVPWADVRDGVPLEQVLAAIVDEDRPRVDAAIMEAVRTCGRYRCEYRVRAGDGVRWLMATGRCAAGRDGGPGRFSGVVVDISERKEREEEIALMARELSHRIKNIFTVVQAMASMAAREEPEARPALEKLTDRFAAMAAAYDFVAPFRDISTPGRLMPMLEQLFAPYTHRGQPRIQVRGPDLRLHSKVAASLALIMHERATNAAKYGALSCGGHVRLTVKPAGDGQWSFEWEESGGPPVSGPPATEGFGTRLIRSSAASLGAEITQDWRPEGLRWHLIVPEERLQGG